MLMKAITKILRREFSPLTHFFLRTETVNFPQTRTYNYVGYMAPQKN
jgi:hypothetical protein